MSAAVAHGARRRAWPARALDLHVALVLVFLALPTLAVVPMSFNAAEFLIFPPPGYSTRWYAAFFERREWWGSAITSLIVAVLATAIATVLGTTAALAIARGRVPLRGAVAALLLTPMMVPAIVTAVALYRVFAAWGIAGTIPGLVAAHVVMALPFVLVNVSAVLNRMDWTVLRAARSLGAPPLYAFRRITLPMIRPGVLAGALFAFLTSFDEVVVSLFMTGIGAMTLPVQMWTGIRFEINPIVAAVSTMLILVTASTFTAFALLRRTP